MLMGRPSNNLTLEEKKEKSRQYSRLYKIKIFNIKNNITEMCPMCNKEIIVNPLRPHKHWCIRFEKEIITFD